MHYSFRNALRLIASVSCAAAVGPIGSILGNLAGGALSMIIEGYAQAGAGIFSGISADLVEDLAKEISVPPNHDIQRAMAAALSMAIRNKRKEFRAKQGVKKRLVRSKRLTDMEERLFDVWLNKLKQAKHDEQTLDEFFLGDLKLNEILTMANGEDAEESQWRLTEQMLLTWGGVQTMPQGLRNFLKDNLLQNLETSLAEIIKNPQYSRAWIDFQRSFLLQTVELLDKLKIRLTDLTEEQRQEFDELKLRLNTLATVPSLLAQLAQSVVQLLSLVHEGISRMEEISHERSEALNRIAHTIEDLKELTSGRFIQEGETVEYRRRQHDERVLRELTERTPFVGREDSIFRLNQFVLSGTGYLLTTSPAGGGKSSLMAHWLNSLASQKNDLKMCYHFLSSKWGTEDFNGFLACLSEQLLRVHNMTGEIWESEPLKLRAIITSVLSNPHPSRLVIIVDGLDEARDAQHPGEFAFRKGLFPETLGENSVVIFTARATEGEATTRKLCDQLGLQSMKNFLLPELGAAAVKELLLISGNERLKTKAEDAAFVSQLLKITGGLAIYLRHLTEELKQTNEQHWREIIDKLPSKFEDFVAQIANAGKVRQEWDEALCILAFAKSRLSESDLMELTGLRKRDFVSLPWEVRRWLTIERENNLNFYFYSHSAIAEGYRRYAFSERDAQSYRQKLLEYCANWRESKSSYAMRHYAEHLLEENQIDALYKLARDNAFASAQKETLIDEPTVTLRTIQMALVAAIRSDDAASMVEFSILHARQKLGTTEETPLQALRMGNLQRAWQLADLLEIEYCSLWYLLLAWALKEKRLNNQAIQTLERLSLKELTSLSGWQGLCAFCLLLKLHDIQSDVISELVKSLLGDLQSSTNTKYLSTPALFGKAVKLARIAHEESWQASALHSIVVAHIKEGKLEEAIATIDQADDEPARELAFESVTKAYIEKMEFERAIATAGRIDSKEPRVSTLVKIAKAQTGSGQKEEAHKVLEEAIANAKQIDDKRSRASAIADIAKALAALGRKEEARELLEEAIAAVRQLLDTAEGTMTLADVTEAMVELGEGEVAGSFLLKALANAKQIDDKRSRASAIADIAKALAALGRKEEARELLEEAIGTAKQIHDKWKRSSALSSIVDTQAEMGEFKQAITTAKQIEDDWRRGWALAGIAETEAREGKFDQAIAAVSQIDNQMVWASSLPSVFASIARMLMKKGDVGHAITLAKQIDNEWHRAFALTGIAEAQFRMGEFKQAITTAKQIEDLTKRASAIADIAKALAALGRKEEARELLEEAIGTAKQIHDKWKRSSALSSIVDTQAEMGEFKQAITTAKQIDSVERSSALQSVILAQLRRDEFEQAITYAREINDEQKRVSIQASILESIVKIQLERDEFEQAMVTAAQIDDVQERSSAFESIVEDQIRRGEFKQATTTASRIEKGVIRVRALAEIAKAQTGSGQNEEAHKVLEEAIANAKQIDDKDSQVFAFAEIAKAQARTGQKEEAHKILQEAIATAKQIDDVHSGNLIFQNLAWAQAEIGESEQAIAFAKEMGSQQDLTLLFMAQAQAERGEIEQAIVTAKQIDAQLEKSSALGDIVEVLVKKGEFPQAITIAKQENRAEGRIFARRAILESIARAQADRGEIEQAIATTRQAADRWETVSYLARIAGSETRKHQKEMVDRLLKEAIKIEEMIDRAPWRVSALKKIATAQIKVGKFEQVIMTLERINGDKGRASAIDAISNSLAELDHKVGTRELLEEVIATAKQIKNDGERGWALATIAVAQAKSGQKEAANRLLEEAITITERIDDMRSRVVALSFVAVAQARLDQKDGAHRLLEKASSIAKNIDDASSRDSALTIIAIAQAETDELSQASSTTAIIENEPQRAASLASIAAAQAKAGQKEAARESIEEVASIEKHIGDEWIRTFTLKNIVVALNRMNEFARAVDTANQIDDATSRVLTLTDIAVAQAKSGQKEAANRLLEEAITIAKQISAAWSHAEALADIACAQAELNRKDDAHRFLGEATAITESMDGVLSRLSALVDIAVAQAKSGQKEAANRLLEEAITNAKRTGDLERLLIFKDIIRAQAEIGPYEQAIIIAKQEHIFGQSSFEPIVEAYVRKGEFEQAINAAKHMDDEMFRVPALAEIARAQATRGLVEEALLTTGNILTDRATHLVRVAEAVAETGNREKFKLLLMPCAQYLEAADVVCSLLVKFYPEQVTKVAQILH